MGILDFKTARAKKYAPIDAPVIADLDAILADPVYFKWDGKNHAIKPMSTKQYLRVLDKYSDLFSMNKAESKPTEEELQNGFGDLFSMCIDTIGRKEVARMTPVQVGAIMQLIIEAITGKAQADTVKKKVKN